MPVKQRRQQDELIWSITENMLLHAEAEVLEIFDWQVLPLSRYTNILIGASAVMLETWDPLAVRDGQLTHSRP